jgi:hypothetical protein
MSMEPDPTTLSEPPIATPARGTNGFAVASLVLGIVGLTAFPVIPSLLALIFGYKGRAEIDRSGGAQEGRGLAIAGITLGWIGVVVAALFVFFVVRTLFASWGAVEIGPIREIRP